jgi:SWI/SNF-related matrix-associated actin-dependent regulator of chromatin subfamily A protein 2/4
LWDDEEEDISLKKRRRKDVDYSDSLTEKEWLKVIGASLEEEAANNDNDDTESVGNGSGNGGSRSGRRKRGKYKKRGYADEDSGEEEPPRKRGRPKMNPDSGGSSKSMVSPKLKKLMKKIMNIVVEHADEYKNKMIILQSTIVFFTTYLIFREGRVLSDPFMKLPSRKEYPDYFEIIKKPIDIKKILNKIDNGMVRFSNVTCILSNLN